MFFHNYEQIKAFCGSNNELKVGNNLTSYMP